MDELDLIKSWRIKYFKANRKLKDIKNLIKDNSKDYEDILHSILQIINEDKIS